MGLTLEPVFRGDRYHRFRAHALSLKNSSHSIRFTNDHRAEFYWSTFISHAGEASCDVVAVALAVAEEFIDGQVAVGVSYLVHDDILSRHCATPWLIAYSLLWDFRRLFFS